MYILLFSFNKRLCYCRGTARSMGVKNVSNSKGDLQGHSRAL